MLYNFFPTLTSVALKQMGMIVILHRLKQHNKMPFLLFKGSKFEWRRQRKEIHFSFSRGSIFEAKISLPTHNQTLLCGSTSLFQGCLLPKAARCFHFSITVAMPFLSHSSTLRLSLSSPTLCNFIVSCSPSELTFFPPQHGFYTSIYFSTLGLSGSRTCGSSYQPESLWRGFTLSAYQNALHSTAAQLLMLSFNKHLSVYHVPGTGLGPSYSSIDKALCL